MFLALSMVPCACSLLIVVGVVGLVYHLCNFGVVLIVCLEQLRNFIHGLFGCSLRQFFLTFPDNSCYLTAAANALMNVGISSAEILSRK